MTQPLFGAEEVVAPVPIPTVVHPVEPELTIAGSVTFMRFVFSGDPKAKGRPRGRAVTPGGGGKPFVHMYTDEQTEQYEGDIVAQVKDQLRRWANDASIVGELTLPIKGRVICSLRFNMRRPASLPKKVQFPLKKPDIDNLVKSVLDGIVKSNVLNDDNVITDCFAVKRFADSEHPVGVEVELTAWSE
jgi:Holliday junction resolvase RusA-like endonuclease